MRYTAAKLRCNTTRCPLYTPVSPTGGISVASWGVGPVLSGYVMSRLHVDTPLKAMKMVCSIMTLVNIGYIVLFFLGCPNDQWAGDVNMYVHVRPLVPGGGSAGAGT